MGVVWRPRHRTRQTEDRAASEVAPGRLDEALLQLAFRQLDDQDDEYRASDRRWTVLTGAALTLGVALLSIRATATSAALQTVPAFQDHWWPPLLGFALAAGLLTLDRVLAPRQLIGPDPQRVRATLEAATERHPEVSSVRMLTLAVVDAYEQNLRELRRHRRRGLGFLGTTVLLVTVVATGLCYALVR